MSFVFWLTACGPDPGPRQTLSVPSVKTEDTTSAPVELTEEEKIAAVRAEYELIVREVEGEVLQKDSLEYSCDFSGGKYLFYTGPDNDLRLAINSYNEGDHFGATEYWYFAEGQPVFLLKESGSWQFGGEMTIGEDGNEYPGTIDNITEDRMYFADGRLIRHLTKAYVIKSYEETTPADQVPNETVAHNGEMPDDLNNVLYAFKNREVNCPESDE